MQYFHILIFSLFVHVALVSLLDKVPDNRKEQVPIEVQYEPAQSRSVVRETETRDIKETEKERKARFLSEREKRFKEESRARNSGISQNAGGGAPKPPTPEKQKENEGPGPNKVAKQFQPSPNSIMPPGPGVGPRAAVGEKLPDDVKFGSFNALNSDRFLFYSFFARIEERIRPRWEMSVKSVLQETNPILLKRKEWLTVVEVILDKSGKFQRAILHQKSGIEGLDVAAVEAFRAGSPFQNPPREMVKEDGRIHLQYSISVSAN